MVGTVGGLMSDGNGDGDDDRHTLPLVVPCHARHYSEEVRVYIRSYACNSFLYCLHPDWSRGRPERHGPKRKWIAFLLAVFAFFESCHRPCTGRRPVIPHSSFTVTCSHFSKQSASQFEHTNVNMLGVNVSFASPCLTNAHLYSFGPPETKQPIYFSCLFEK